ncbi:retrovirus-related pol polyprotein from transposon RE1 [Citrus sinensis]|nr:retrovirus-related pol polyprotein from transposon RE1 [Citrus sinensis]
MLSSMVDNVLIMVINCESSLELWERLGQIFMSQSKARFLPLKLHIQSTKKGSLSVSDYFNKMKKITDSLAIGGNALSSNELIMHLLTGLDDSYESLVTNILTRLEKEELTVEEVYSMLLSHETRLEMSKGKLQNELMHDMTANFAQKGQNHNKNNFGTQKNNNSGGNFGGFTGGYGDNRNANAGFSLGRDIVCQICFIPGHSAYKCKNRFNQGFVPRNKVFGGFRPRGGQSYQNFRTFAGNGQNNYQSFGRGFGSGYPRQTAPFQGYLAYQAPSFIYPQQMPEFQANNGNYHHGVFPGSAANPMFAGQATSSAPVATYGTVADSAWYLDSGATNHVTQDPGIFVHCSAYFGNDKLHVGNGMGLAIESIGSAVIQTLSTSYLYLNNILLVPAITKNLLSISKLLADNNAFIEFFDCACFVKAKNTGIILLKGIARAGLYQVENLSAVCDSSKFPVPVSSLSKSVSVLKINAVSMFAQFDSSNTLSQLQVPVNDFQFNKTAFMTSAVSNSKSVDCNILHKRMGHPTVHALHQIMKRLNSNFPIDKTIKPQFCDACQFGKCHMQHFPSIETSTTQPLELLHADLWGPAPISSSQGYHYYLSIIDDYTRFTWIFPLTAKSNTLSVFTNFKNMIENSLEKKIKCLQTDWGGEFRSFVPYLASQGIQFRHPCPYIHHQNGKVERKHRHIVETGLTLLAQAHLPLKFWWNAFHTAVYLINRLPTPVLNNKSPFEMLFHKIPDYTVMKVFGCSCYPYLRPYNHHKFAFRSQRCIFLGYSSHHKGYVCLHSSGRIYISNHVVFYETTFPFESGVDFSSADHSSSSLSSHSVKPQVTFTLSQSTFQLDGSALQSSPAADLLSPSSSLSSPELNTQSQITPSTPNHHLSPPSQLIQGHPMVTRSKAGIFKPKTTFLTTSSSSPHEPYSISEALADSKWLQAMKLEYQALMDNKTWTLVQPSFPVKVIGSKWVYRIKYNPDGSISRYKARLVAKGFHQTQGIDFNETFSPVVKASIVKVILSLAVLNHWTLRQVDINNAFLNGHLTEEVYMEQPAGFVDQSRPHHICKLQKALYGLKQAPRAWFDKLKQVLTAQWGFRNSKSDTSLFFKRVQGHLLLVLVYVDDIIVTGSSTCLIQQVISNLQSTFALKDLGELNYFLGIQVVKNSSGLHLSQSKYIVDLLHKVNLQDCTPCSTPMAAGTSLTKSDSELFANATLYRSTIGALQSATLTRPEIAFSVNKLSQFLAAPTVNHWQACKRILRYLKGTLHLGLQFYSHGVQSLDCFSDADWASDKDDRRSIAGYCVFLGSNLVSWCSKKQAVVSRSSTESEYRALALAASEVLWMKSLLTELGVSLISTPVIWCDNQSAAALTSNPKFHARTKHIELDVHFLREKVANQSLQVSYIPSSDNTADILTKALAHKPFHYLCSKLNLSSPS